MTDKAREQGWLILPLVVMLLAFALGLLIGATTVRADPYCRHIEIDGSPMTLCVCGDASMVSGSDPSESELLAECGPQPERRQSHATIKQHHLLGPLCLILDEEDNIVGLTGPEECEDD